MTANQVTAITVKEIKALFARFIAVGQRSGIESLKIVEDRYLKVSPESMYNFANTAQELECCSLMQEMERLKSVLTGDNPFTCDDCERLGNILIYISTYLPQIQQQTGKPWLLLNEDDLH